MLFMSYLAIEMTLFGSMLVLGRLIKKEEVVVSRGGSLPLDSITSPTLPFAIIFSINELGDVIMSWGCGGGESESESESSSSSPLPPEMCI